MADREQEKTTEEVVEVDVKTTESVSESQPAEADNNAADPRDDQTPQ